MRRLIVIALAGLLVLTLGGTALAQTWSGEGEVDVSGKGWLAARGTGTATLDMGGSLRLAIDGDVVINDLAGDMTVEITGFAPEAIGPEVTLEDFRGRVIVRGSHFTVEADGKMRFLAHGRGIAHLEGEGVVKTRHSDVHRWDEDPTVELS